MQTMRSLWEAAGVKLVPYKQHPEVDTVFGPKLALRMYDLLMDVETDLNVSNKTHATRWPSPWYTCCQCQLHNRHSIGLYRSNVCDAEHIPHRMQASCKC